MRSMMHARFPHVQAGSATVGQDRLIFARRMLDFSATFQLLEGHPSNFLYRAYLVSFVFGVNMIDIGETDELLERISQVDLSLPWGGAAPTGDARSWLRGLLYGAAGKVATTEEGKYFLSLRAIIAINLSRGSALRFPEYTLLQEESPYADKFELSADQPEESFTVMCYQRGRISGDQLHYPIVSEYFADDEHWTLRRIDSVVILPRDRRVIEQTFAYDTAADIPADTFNHEPKALRSRVLQRFQPAIDADQRDVKLTLMPAATPKPLRHSQSSGFYAYAYALISNANVVGGFWTLPQQILLSGDTAQLTRGRLIDLTLPFINIIVGVFELRITTKIRREFNAVRVNPQLDFFSFFPKGFPTNSTLTWYHVHGGKVEELPRLRNRLAYSPSERNEELAGIYQVDFISPNFDEVLEIELEYNLMCRRCKLHYNASTNTHGSCQFHSSHPDEYALAYENEGVNLADLIELSEKSPEKSPERQGVVDSINRYLSRHFAPIAGNLYAKTVARKITLDGPLDLRRTLPLSWMIELIIEDHSFEVSNEQMKGAFLIRENFVYLKSWLRERNYSTSSLWNGLNVWYIGEQFNLDLFMELMTLEHFLAITGRNSNERKWLANRLIGRTGTPGLAVRRFSATDNADEATAVLEGVRTLNPNIYHGIAQTSRPGANRPLSFVCCRRATVEPGCYVGRHNSETAVPDVSDLLNGRRGTEWQLDPATGDDRAAKIKELYSKGLIMAGTQLELEFNRVHGGILVPDLGLVPNQLQLLKQVLDRSDNVNTLEDYEEIVEAANFARPFRRWLQSREAQLDYGQVAVANMPPERISRYTDIYNLFKAMQAIEAPTKEAVDRARETMLRHWLFREELPIFTPGLTPLEQIEFTQITEQYAEETAQLVELYEDLRAQLQEVQNGLRRVEQLPSQIPEKGLRKLLRQAWNPEQLRNTADGLSQDLYAQDMGQARSASLAWLQEQYERTEDKTEFRRLVHTTLRDLQNNGKMRTARGTFIDVSTIDTLEVRYDTAQALFKQIDDIYEAMRSAVERYYTGQEEVRQLADAIVAEIPRVLGETQEAFNNQLAKLGVRAEQFRRNRDLLSMLPEGRDLYSDYDNGVFYLRWKPIDFMSTLFLAAFENKQAEADQLLVFYTSRDFRLMSKETGEKLLAQLRDTAGFGVVVAEAMLPNSTVDAINILFTLPLPADAPAQLLKQREDLAENGADKFGKLFRETWVKNQGHFAFQEFDELFTGEKVFIGQPDWNFFFRLADGTEKESGKLSNLIRLYDALLDDGPLSDRQIQLDQDTISTLTGTEPGIVLNAEQVLEAWAESESSRSLWRRTVESAIDFVHQSDEAMLTNIIDKLLSSLKTQDPNTLLQLAPILAANKIELQDLPLGFATWILRNPGNASRLWQMLAQVKAGKPLLTEAMLMPFLAYVNSELERQLSGLAPLPWDPIPFEPLRRLLRQASLKANEPLSPWVISRAALWGAQPSQPQSEVAIRGLLDRCNDFAELLTTSTGSLSPERIYRLWQSSKAIGWRRNADVAKFAEELEALSKLEQPLESTFVLAIMSVATSLLEQAEVQPVNDDNLSRRWQFLRHDDKQVPLRTDYQPAANPTMDKLADLYLNIRENNPAIDEQGLIEEQNRLAPIPLDKQAESVIASEIEMFEREALARIDPGGYEAVSTLLDEFSQTEIPYGWTASRQYPFSPMIYLVMGILAGSAEDNFDVWMDSISDVGRREYRPYFDHVKAAVVELRAALTTGLDETMLAGLDMIHKTHSSYESGITLIDTDGTFEHIHGNPLLLRPVWDTSSEQRQVLKVAWETVLSSPLLNDNPILHKYLDQPDVQIYRWLAATLARYEDGAEKTNPLFEHLYAAGNPSRSTEVPDALTYFVRAFAFHLPNDVQLASTGDVVPRTKGKAAQAGVLAILDLRRQHRFAFSLARNLIPRRDTNRYAAFSLGIVSKAN